MNNNFSNFIFNFDRNSRDYMFFNKKASDIDSCDIMLHLRLYEEESPRVVDSLIFLEWLTSQRPHIRKISVSAGGMQKDAINIFMTLTVRPPYLENLISYLATCVTLHAENPRALNSSVRPSVTSEYTQIINDILNIKSQISKTKDSLVTEFSKLQDSMQQDKNYFNQERLTLKNLHTKPFAFFKEILGFTLVVSDSSFFFNVPDYLFKFNEPIIFRIHSKRVSASLNSSGTSGTGTPLFNELYDIPYWNNNEKPQNTPNEISPTDIWRL